MSAEASTWSKWRPTPDPLSKQVLRELADFADPDGRVWAAIATLASVTGRSERHVQRGMATLKDAGLLLATDAFHRTKAGQRVPVYQLNFAMPDPERGDTDVTPCGGEGVTRASPLSEPRGDAGVVLRGDAGVTQANLGTNSHSSDEEREARAQSAFDRLAKVWIGVDPDKLDRPRAWAAFQAIVDGGIDADGLADAGIAFATSEKRRTVPLLSFWLKDGTWEGRIATKAARDAPRTRFADETVRASVVGAKGEDFARSYLDPAGWDALRRITPRTRLAAERLRADLAWLWRKLGVGILDPQPAET